MIPDLDDDAAAEGERAYDENHGLDDGHLLAEAGGLIPVFLGLLGCGLQDRCQPTSLPFDGCEYRGSPAHIS
jgi:hypothetical protein